MAEFTSFNAPARVTGTISVDKATADTFGGGQGLITAGKAITGFAGVLEAKAIKDETARINQTNLDTQAQFSKRFHEAKEGADENATGFTDNMLAEFDGYAAKTLDGARTPREKKALQLDLTRNRIRILERSIVFESATRGTNQRKTFVRNGATSASIVRDDPREDIFASTLEARAKEIANTSLPEGDKAELLDKEKKNLRYAQFSSMIDNATTPEDVENVLAVQESLPDGEFSKAADIRIANEASSRVKEFKLEDRLAKTEQRQAVTRARQGVSSLKGRLSEGQTIAPDDLKMAQDLVTASGDPAVAHEFATVMQVGSLVKKWKKLSSEELSFEVAQLEKDVVTDGATVRENLKLRAAERVLRSVASGERKEQSEIDTGISEAFTRIEKRLRGDADLSKDPDMMIVGGNLRSASPALQERIREGLSVNKAAQEFADLSVAEASKKLAELEASRANSDPNEVRYNVASELYAKMQKTIKKNYADQQIEVDDAYPDLAGGSPENIAARGQAMEEGAKKYNQSQKRFHTTEEISSITTRLQGKGSQKRLEFVNAYVNGLSPENARIALNEFSETMPMLAYAGAGIAVNKSFLTTANSILNGEELRAAQGNSSITGSRENKMKSTEDSIDLALSPVMNNRAINPNHKASVKEAALSLMASESFLTPNQAVSKALGSADDGTGGLQEFNGKPFIAPMGVTSEQIEDALMDNKNAITELAQSGSVPRTSTGRVISADEILSAGTLENVGPNMYVVRMKSDGKIVQGDSRSPYVLEITPERLSGLTPGAAPDRTVEGMRNVVRN